MGFYVNSPNSNHILPITGYQRHHHIIIIICSEVFQQLRYPQPQPRLDKRGALGVLVLVGHIHKAARKLACARTALLVVLNIDEHIELRRHVSRHLDLVYHKQLVLLFLLLLAPRLLGPLHDHLHNRVKLPWKDGCCIASTGLLLPCGISSGCLRHTPSSGSGPKPWNLDFLVRVSKFGTVKAVSNLHSHQLGVLVVEEERSVQPVRVREVPVRAPDPFPQVPHAVHVRMVGVEDGIACSRVEVPHILTVGLVSIPGPHVDRPMWNVLQRPGSRVRVVPRPVGRAQEELRRPGVGHHLPVHDHEIVHNLLPIGGGGIDTVEVEIDDLGWLVSRVAELVVERRGGVGVYGGHYHSSWGIPVPEGHRKGLIPDQLAEHPFEEVEVESVEREEEPGEVHLQLQVREAHLVICT